MDWGNFVTRLALGLLLTIPPAIGVASETEILRSWGLPISARVIETRKESGRPLKEMTYWIRLSPYPALDVVHLRLRGISQFRAAGRTLSVDEAEIARPLFMPDMYVSYEGRLIGPSDPSSALAAYTEMLRISGKTNKWSRVFAEKRDVVEVMLFKSMRPWQDWTAFLEEVPDRPGGSLQRKGNTGTALGDLDVSSMV
jgi:hypothetical protein